MTVPAFCLRIGLLLLVASRTAAAMDVNECVEDHYQGQVIRSQGALVEAHRRFQACASASCPEVVRSACADLLSEVAASLPTVTVTARDPSGRTVNAAHVTIDASPETEVDGRAIPVDPGAHRITVRAAGFRASTQTRHFDANGENRQLDFVLRPVDAGHAVAGPAPLPEPLPPAVDAGATSPEQDAHQIHPLAYVFGGLGLVAAGSWAYFGISALREKGQQDCYDYQPCASGVNDKLLVSGISLGVSLASFGAGAYFLFAKPRDSKQAGRAVSVSASPRAGGGQLDLRATF